MAATPKRMKAAVTAMSGGEATLDVEFCQLVKLFRAGEPVAMSKRSGDLVTLREVVEEVGAGSVRFMMLFRKADAPLDFDFQKVHRAVEGQPGLLRAVRACAHGLGAPAGGRKRCRSLRSTPNRSPTPISCFWRMQGSARWCGRWRIGRECSKLRRVAREPHQVAFYLYDLASAFHAHWNKGKELPQLRFIRPGRRRA